jgi:hypothetical protein
MFKRGVTGGLALVVGSFATVLCIAQASASNGAETDGRPLVMCILDDGAPCEAGAIDAAEDGGPGEDGSSASEDGAAEASTVDAATPSDAGPTADAGLPPGDAGSNSDAASADDAASTDAGSSSTPGNSSGSSGCGCEVVGADASGAGLLLMCAAFALLGARRSRRSA